MPRRPGVESAATIGKGLRSVTKDHHLGDSNDSDDLQRKFSNYTSESYRQILNSAGGQNWLNEYDMHNNTRTDLANMVTDFEIGSIPSLGSPSKKQQKQIDKLSLPALNVRSNEVWSQHIRSRAQLSPTKRRDLCSSN